MISFFFTSTDEHVYFYIFNGFMLEHLRFKDRYLHIWTSDILFLILTIASKSKNFKQFESYHVRKLKKGNTSHRGRSHGII